MLSIIAVHTEFFHYSTAPYDQIVLNLSVLQLFKFGTICFFMISGFLLGGQLDSVRPGVYFRRRLDSTAAPWALWAGGFALLVLGSNLLLGRTGFADLARVVGEVLFGSAYWFIPNFLLALGVLLACRRVIDRPWFGVLLGAASLVYAANIYARVLPTGHTTALFGFVFYLWLGVQLRRRAAPVRAALDRLPTALLVGVAVVAAIVGLAEARALVGTGVDDVLNTLRLSNQVYSLAVFALLLRVRVPLFPRWMEVPNHTFGLYLVHWIVMNVVFVGVAFVGGAVVGVPWTAFQGQAIDLISSPIARLLLWLALGAAVYGLSFGLTRALAAHPRWRRTVGARGVPARAASAPSPAYGTDD